MSKNKFSFALVVMIIATGCNTQATNDARSPGANAQEGQNENDDRPIGRNDQESQTEPLIEGVTQIFLDGEEFTELFGDSFSISNPSPVQLGELEDVADTKSGSEKEELEEKIQKCKSAPVRCEIISD